MQVTTRIDGLTFTQVAEKRSLMLSQTEGGKGFFRDPSNKAFFAVNCDMAICFTRETWPDQLPVGLLAQLVRALHRYSRGQGSNPGKPDFFQAFFSQLHKLR